MAAVAVVLGLLGVLRVAPSLLVRETDVFGLRIYSKNLLAGNANWQAIAEDVLDQNVEVVVFQEVSVFNLGILEGLSTEFPYQHLCDFSNWSAMAVLSRSPFVGEGVCSDWRAMAAAQIEWDGRAVWVVSVHVPWHWPEGDVRHEVAAREMVAGLDGPMILAGDFNSFPWTHRVRELSSRAGGSIVGPTRPTYWLRGVPLFLDHVIVPQGWAATVDYRPFLQADHLGILAEVAIPLP